MTDGGEVRISRAGVRWGWVTVGVLAVPFGVAVACAVAGWLPASFLPSAAYPLLLVEGSLVWLLTRRGSDAVVLTKEHLAVEGRNGPHRWEWGQLLEVGSSATGGVPYLTPGLVVLIRPEGSGWATPGPNMPLSVPLPVFGRGALRRAAEALRTACAEHDVPFNENGLRMAEQPRPDSSLRTDRQPDPTTKGPDA